MIEVIVRETEEVEMGGRTVKITTEEIICSFKEHGNFGRVAKKIREIINEWIMKATLVKAGIF